MLKVFFTCRADIKRTLNTTIPHSNNRSNFTLKALNSFMNFGIFNVLFKRRFLNLSKFLNKLLVALFLLFLRSLSFFLVMLFVRFFSFFFLWLVHLFFFILRRTISFFKGNFNKLFLSALSY